MMLIVIKRNNIRLTSLSTLNVSGPRIKLVFTIVWSEFILTMTSPSLFNVLKPNNVARTFCLDCFLLDCDCFVLFLLFPDLELFFFLLPGFSLDCWTGGAWSSVVVTVTFWMKSVVPVFVTRTKAGSRLSLSKNRNKTQFSRL